MAQHPYHPADLELPGFVPQLLGFDFILSVFFGGFITLFLGTWLVSGPPLRHRATLASPAAAGPCLMPAAARAQAASRSRPRSASSPAGSCAPA